MKKYKTYTLYAKVVGTESEKYTVGEALRDDCKRGQELMSGSLIEDLDKLTSKYISIDDLLESYPQEVFGENIKLYDPVIIVDKDEKDRSKSYILNDIVFEPDAKELEDKENIRMWLLDYLNNNPDSVNNFRGLRSIYDNVKKKYDGINPEYLINITVLKYFEDNNYKRYREAYFTLKELEDIQVKRR